MNVEPVLPNFVHEGRVYTRGEVFEVDEATGKEGVLNGSLRAVEVGAGDGKGDVEKPVKPATKRVKKLF